MNSISVSARFSAFRAWFKSFFLLGDGPGRNTAMEGLRGYAVLLVVFIHALGHVVFAHRHINPFKADADPVWVTAKKHSLSDTALVSLSMGHYAVDLFFLLSAFLITRIVIKQGANFSYLGYVKKRFLRIYPPFLAALLFCMAVQVWWLRTQPFGLKHLAQNLLFLNGCPGFGLLMVSYDFPTWSLFYEFSFYLAFPLIYLLWQRARNGTPTQVFMSSILLLGLLFWSHSFLPRSCTFFFGMLLGARSDDELRQIARGLSTRLVASVYLALILVYALVSRDWGWFSPVFSIGICMLFIKTCYDQGPLNRLFSSLPLRWLGNISFSLYLMHSVTLNLIEEHLKVGTWKLQPLVDGAVFFALSLGLSLLLSVVLFATVERWHFRKATRPAAAPVAQPEVADAQPRLAA